jgi:hypothetical protein
MTTDPTYKTSSSNSPDKIFTVATKRRLLEKSRDKLVILHIEYVLLAQSAAPVELFQAECFVVTALGRFRIDRSIWRR